MKRTMSLVLMAVLGLVLAGGLCLAGDPPPGGDAVISNHGAGPDAVPLCRPDATLEDIILSLPLRFDGSTQLSGDVRFKFPFEGNNSSSRVVDADYYTLSIADGVARVVSGKLDNPALKITCPASVYLDIEFGRISPATAIATGDLIVNDRELARAFLEHFPLFYVYCGY